MTLESVLACAKENQTQPSVSRAAIMDSLGLTVLSFTLPSPFLGAHTFRTKLDSLSQVSSMLMILVLLSSSGSICSTVPVMTQKAAWHNRLHVARGRRLIILLLR